MGIWLELGIFLLVIVWGIWQLYDVKKAQAKTRAEKAAQAVSEQTGQEHELP